MLGFRIGDIVFIVLICLLIAGLVALSNHFKNR